MDTLAARSVYCGDTRYCSEKASAQMTTVGLQLFPQNRFFLLHNPEEGSILQSVKKCS